MDDLDDTHFCLKCKATITGLDNYVSHRKQNCLADKQITVDKHPSENLGLESQINDFFTSLELQSTCTLPKNKPEDEEDVHQFSDDDEYFPPRTHTGGKWTPGTRPDLTNEQLCSTPVANNNKSDQVCLDKSAEQHCSNENEECSKILGNLVEPFHNSSREKENNGGQHEILQPNEMDHERLVHSKLNCPRCSMSFRSEKDFAVHQFSLEHKEKFIDSSVWLEEINQFQASLLNYFPYHCHLCSCYYLDWENLNSHIKSKHHHEKVKSLGKPLFCLPCQFECQNNDKMIHHLSSEVHKLAVKEVLQNHPVIVISQDSTFNCSSCPEQQCIFLKLKEKLNQDIHASSIDVVKCSECTKQFESDIEHNKHILLDHPDCRCCKPCNLVFQSVDALCHHLLSRGHKLKLSQNINNSGQFNCSICRFSSNSEGDFLVHKIQHSEPVVVKNPENSTTKMTRKFRCSICQKAFFLSSLRNHIYSHTGERPFPCTICSKRFSQKASLKIHMNRHEEAKSYRCEHCSYKTIYKSSILKHGNKHKTKQQKHFLCEICGASYSSQRSLYQHALIHGKLKYKCQQKSCFYAFRTPSELTAHEVVHSNEKPYLCDTCGFAVKSPHQLKKHQRQHTREKPFKCTYCNYTATLSSNILRHMRLHSGSKPYKCPYCQYTCNTQENIRKHILKTKKHAGKMMYPCQHCLFACNEFQKYKIHLLENHHEHYSETDKKIESSVITGLYVKDEPRKTLTQPIPYTPRSERKIARSENCDATSVSVANPSVLFVNGPLIEKTIDQSTETSAVLRSTGNDILSTLTPIILGNDKEITNEMNMTTEVSETMMLEKDMSGPQFMTCTKNAGDLYKTIFIYNVCCDSIPGIN